MKESKPINNIKMTSIMNERVPIETPDKIEGARGCVERTSYGRCKTTIEIMQQRPQH